MSVSIAKLKPTKTRGVRYRARFRGYYRGDDLQLHAFDSKKRITMHVSTRRKHNAKKKGHTVKIRVALGFTSSLFNGTGCIIYTDIVLHIRDKYGK
ncbi:hypothetical protein [uncultured Limosilactobacillus sp.]|uniref:hypothetical protein n=1 Tax=uncultured Limosilactobacillus sp. TaxID=2837629 RepID=UPI0025FD4158|nr:hypothetical protein [uncultured Limosilactobacillus sp.]